jgi:hypothetical protein
VLTCLCTGRGSELGKRSSTGLQRGLLFDGQAVVVLECNWRGLDCGTRCFLGY